MSELLAKTTWKTVAYVLATVLLFLSTMFVSIDVFVEAAIISKWYVFILGGLTCLLVITLSKRAILTFDRLSVLLCVFIGYVVLRGLLSNMITIQLLLLVCFFAIYLLFKSCDISNNYTIRIIVAVCLLQACYGILQYIGIYYVAGAFKIVGSFDNPAGFAACLAVGYPFCFSVGGSTKLKWVGVVSAVVIALSVILSGSRAGIIAIVLTTCIYVYHRFKDSLKNKRIYLTISVVLLLSVGVSLFFYKKNSALGRLLVWENSLEMIADKPIFGHGANSFSAEYMKYQADYFAENPNSDFANLADNVSHPFNEYVLLTIEYGLMGLFTLILMLVVIFYQRKITIPLLSVVAIAVFACFSYPLRYSFVFVVLSYSLACIPIGKRHFIRLNIAAKSMLMIAVGISATFLVKDVMFEYRWGRLVQSSYFGQTKNLMGNYDALYEKWNGDIYFTYNYGALLNSTGNYRMSNNVITECAEYFNDYDIQMLMADNYYNLKEMTQAENRYLLANRMIPCRFRPLYNLMLLYVEMGRVTDAKKMARKIIDMEIKVPSQFISNAKKEAAARLK